MMTSTRHNTQGFILTMVLLTLVIVGLIMSYLTQNTQMLINQTHRQQIAAINRNQILSARAWARLQQGSELGTIVLDSNDLSTRPTELTLDWLDDHHIDIVARARWGTLSGKQQQSMDIDHRSEGD